MLTADVLMPVSRVLGCSVCFGAADSPLTAGLNMGIDSVSQFVRRRLKISSKLVTST